MSHGRNAKCLPTLCDLCFLVERSFLATAVRNWEMTTINSCKLGIFAQLSTIFTEEQMFVLSQREQPAWERELSWFCSSLKMIQVPPASAQRPPPVSSRLMRVHLFVSSLGLRLSNRDCACLRLSQGFEVGSYPSSAIQPSIPA